MNRLIVILMVLMLVCGVSCNYAPQDVIRLNAQKVDLSELEKYNTLVEVRPNVYDDGNGLVCFNTSSANTFQNTALYSALELSHLRKSWEILYPNKQLYSIAAVSYGTGYIGLYEKYPETSEEIPTTAASN